MCQSLISKNLSCICLCEIGGTVKKKYRNQLKSIGISPKAVRFWRVASGRSQHNDIRGQTRKLFGRDLTSHCINANGSNAHPISNENLRSFGNHHVHHLPDVLLLPAQSHIPTARDSVPTMSASQSLFQLIEPRFGSVCQNINISQTR